MVFAGPHYDTMFVTSGKVLVKLYGGGLAENRTNDDAFFMIRGYGSQGFKSYRARISDNQNEVSMKKC